MPALQTTFEEVHDYFPKTAAHIDSILFRKLMRAKHDRPTKQGTKWFYDFRPRHYRDEVSSPHEVRLGVYAIKDRFKVSVGDWKTHDPESAGRIPPSLEYAISIQQEGVRHHNTPHEAVISWHEPSKGGMADYLVSAGVEMPDGSTRIAVVWVGAPIILRDPRTFRRPYMWIEATEQGIGLHNDITSMVSDAIFEMNPGEKLRWQDGAIRRLNADELRRFHGLTYRGRERVKEIEMA